LQAAPAEGTVDLLTGGSRMRRFYGPAALSAGLLLVAGTASAQSIPGALGWFQVPNSSLMTVCAATHGFPEVAGGQGCPGIMNWSGGAFDSRRNRLLVFGGGHNDYYGNEIYGFDLDSLTMTRLTDPGLPPASSCTETIAGGTQPNSRHSYDGVEYIAAHDRLYIHEGSLACGNGNFSLATWTFDFATMRWQRMDPVNGDAITSTMGSSITTAYDPVTGLVFMHNRAVLRTYHFPSNTYRIISTNAGDIGRWITGAIDPGRRQFVIVGQTNAGFRVYTYDISRVQSNGTISGGLTSLVQRSSTNPGISAEFPGVDYHPGIDRVVLWNGGDTVRLFNLDNNTWSSLTFSGGPGAAYANDGTLGRWRYSAASGVFVLVNSSTQNVYTLRLSASPSDNVAPGVPQLLQIR
jgi:hypothetical protein